MGSAGLEHTVSRETGRENRKSTQGWSSTKRQRSAAGPGVDAPLRSAQARRGLRMRPPTWTEDFENETTGSMDYCGHWTPLGHSESASRLLGPHAIVPPA